MFRHRAFAQDTPKPIPPNPLPLVPEKPPPRPLTLYMYPSIIRQPEGMLHTKDSHINSLIISSSADFHTLYRKLWIHTIPLSMYIYIHIHIYIYPVSLRQCNSQSPTEPVAGSAVPGICKLQGLRSGLWAQGLGCSQALRNSRQLLCIKPRTPKEGILQQTRKPPTHKISVRPYIKTDC